MNTVSQNSNMIVVYFGDYKEVRSMLLETGWRYPCYVVAENLIKSLSAFIWKEEFVRYQFGHIAKEISKEHWIWSCIPSWCLQ